MRATAVIVKNLLFVAMLSQPLLPAEASSPMIATPSQSYQFFLTPDLDFPLDFDPSAAVAREESWFQIPTWLTGTWSCTTEVSVLDKLRKGKKPIALYDLRVVRVTVQGGQRDKAGRVWQCAGVPSTTVVDCTTY